MDFSHSILEDNKPAGILSLLENGVPKVSPDSDLSDLKVVDVNGWAPTKDGLAVSNNLCTQAKFQGYEWVEPSSETKEMYKNENDRALKTLLNGEADAMFVYADQAFVYNCERDDEVDTAEWACDLWNGFGTNFAYIQTGMFQTAFNGTTLTMSKHGSGLPAIVNPCIDKFLKTKEYYEICKKHEFVSQCYKNEFFPFSENPVTPPWSLPTSEQMNGCSSGYCGCSTRRA